MNDVFNLEDSAATLTITGWVDRVKALLPEKHWKWMPVVSVVVGIAYAVMAKPGYASLANRIALGAMLGLTASGLFAGVNSALKKTQKG